MKLKIRLDNKPSLSFSRNALACEKNRVPFQAAMRRRLSEGKSTLFSTLFFLSVSLPPSLVLLSSKRGVCLVLKILLSVSTILERDQQRNRECKYTPSKDRQVYHRNIRKEKKKLRRRKEGKMESEREEDSGEGYQYYRVRARGVKREEEVRQFFDLLVQVFISD